MPTLIVLRHAKAVAGLGMADIDRPLNDRGRRDAAATGDWLRDNTLTPDRVLCSTAVRTRETLQGLALDAEVSFEAQIYDNDPETLLSLIRENGDSASRLLLVGHNPSVHQLIFDLTGSAPDAFPTCALAVIEVEPTWSDIRPGAGTLLQHRTPKGN
ncbi:SixA phosphatase family protein [Spirillospora sp. CA-294931]|uniref:SixA phosphatase family protein n=1 Tax=Spirillospora sp. CA-294931 TaxID=3240042 RepID=UPI003D8CA8AF